MHQHEHIQCTSWQDGDVTKSAQRALGVAYGLGRLGLEKDDKAALEMYRNAADGGNAPAQFLLAVAYDLGKLGLEKDEKTALEMHRKAADGGDLYIPHSGFEY